MCQAYLFTNIETSRTKAKTHPDAWLAQKRLLPTESGVLHRKQASKQIRKHAKATWRVCNSENWAAVKKPSAGFEFEEIGQRSGATRDCRFKGSGPRSGPAGDCGFQGAGPQSGPTGDCICKDSGPQSGPARLCGFEDPRPQIGPARDCKLRHDDLNVGCRGEGCLGCVGCAVADGLTAHGAVRCFLRSQRHTCRPWSAFALNFIFRGCAGPCLFFVLFVLAPARA